MADFEDDEDSIMNDNELMQKRKINEDDTNNDGATATTTSQQKKRGRGHEPSIMQVQNETQSGHFDSLNTLQLGNEYGSSNAKIQKSIEGYVVFVSGVHEEAKDDDIYEKFSEFGQVKQFNVPLDRRTG
eukprot:390329_1